MSIYKSLTVVVLLCAAIGGCSRKAEAEDNDAPMVHVDATSQEAAEETPARGKRVISAVLTEPVSTPEDSPEYFRRLAEWNRIYNTRNINAYPYPPRFDAQFLDRYPFFHRLDCTMSKDQAVITCTFEAQPTEIDELSIVAWVPYLSNRDVLNPLLRCTSICINQDSTLVGAVQPAMIKWLATHCKVEPTGRTCN